MLSRQATLLLAHLRDLGTVSTLEARRLYKIEQPATAVFALRKAGYDVRTEFKRDRTGQRYAKYHLIAAEQQAA